MEQSKDQQVEKDKETVPETMKTEESEAKPNATRVSALDMIVESLWKISVFLSDFLVEFSQETSFTEDDEYVVPPKRQFRDFLVSNLNLTHPLEGNGVYDLLVTILDLLPRLGSGNEEEEEETLNSQFEVYETAKKRCVRCKMDTDYNPVERCYGLTVAADSIRGTKSLAKYLSFEEILKVINIKRPCDKEGCEKQNYVPRMINNFPSVFTIGLEWEKNETEGEIIDTTSVLKTEIDISEVYLYEGGSPFTKYHLVSMVCLHGGDQYNCVAYENNRWVMHFGNEQEVIGDWNSVLSVFAAQKIRPTILFYENVMGRSQIMGSDQIVFGTFGQ